LVCNAARLKAGRSADGANLTSALGGGSSSTSGTTSANLTNHGRGTANTTTQHEGRNLLDSHRGQEARIGRKGLERSASLSNEATALCVLHGVGKSLPLVPKLGRHEFGAKLGRAATKARQEIVVPGKPG
jgi:hypothetical protein